MFQGASCSFQVPGNWCLYFGKKIHHFPIDLFTRWVLLRIVPMRFRFTISTPPPAIWFWELYFLATLNWFFPKKICIVFQQPPFCFGSHLIGSKFSHRFQWGNFVPLLEGWTHSLLWESAKWFLCGYTGHSRWPWKGGREVVGGWWEGWWKVGVVCFLFDRQYLAGWKLLFISIKCDFLLSIVNDCFFLVDLIVRNFGRME